MKNAMYRMESLSPFDLQGTAEHLSAMAAKGWRLEKIGRYFWKYQRAEAAYIHYAVTCPPAAEENGDMGDRLFFQELCSAAGWEVVTDWASLQIYANPAEIPTPLETDEALRLEMIHQSMRRTYLRDHRNQLFCFVVLLIFTLTQLFRFPHSYCLSGLGLSLPPFCLLSLFGEAYAIAGYNLWLRRSLRLVEEAQPSVRHPDRRTVPCLDIYAFPPVPSVGLDCTRRIAGTCFRRAIPASGRISPTEGSFPGIPFLHSACSLLSLPPSSRL